MSTHDVDTLPQVITPELKETVQKALKEMSNSMYRSEAESDLRKGIAERMKDECGIPKNMFNRLAKINHAANLAEESAKNEEFLEFAQAILDNGSTTLEFKE